MQKILNDEELQIANKGSGIGIKLDGELVLDMIPDNVASKYLINDADAVMRGNERSGRDYS